MTGVTVRTEATRLAVIGASGRMGQTVIRLAPAHGFEVVCEVSEGDSLAKLQIARAIPSTIAIAAAMRATGEPRRRKFGTSNESEAGGARGASAG